MHPADDRRRALLEWYHANRRVLPWRETTDPWPILVSEVMLQQTQASRVIPAFEAFLSRFPTAGALAAAPASEVLRAWRGLGYQRRARNLRRSAAVIASEGWPESPADLERLPGIGPYTAAAVACFAFGVPVPAVDTNLRRVLSRWHGSPLTGRDLTAAAVEALDAEQPADWNQAMMDLGATVCRPRSPHCGECPVERWCVDPSVYEPPPRQARYEGSIRQTRAAVLDLIAGHDDLGRADVAERLPDHADRLDRAIESLVADGMIAVVDGRFTIGE